MGLEITSLIKKEIAQAIQLLSKNGFKSVARVTGEYVEKLVAQQLEAELADNCQKGFDAFSKHYGKIEIKSRNADSKSYQCTLNKSKLEKMDTFILVIVKDGYVVKALLFPIEKIKHLKTNGGVIIINQSRFDLGEDILDKISPPKSRSKEHNKRLMLSPFAHNSNLLK